MMTMEPCYFLSIKRANLVKSSDLISILPEAMALDSLGERPGRFIIHALSLPDNLPLLPKTLHCNKYHLDYRPFPSF